MSSSESSIGQAAIPLERDLFLRKLVSHLAGRLQQVVGLDEASGFVSLVGQTLGDEINACYREALQRPSLNREEVAEVLVDLKNRIGGEFAIAEQNDEKIVLRSRRCPFGEDVANRPALCMMTSNVLGCIAAENLGYAKVDIQKSIARGDSGCQVVIHLQAGREADASPGREYFKG